MNGAMTFAPSISILSTFALVAKEVAAKENEGKSFQLKKLNAKNFSLTY